MVAAIRITLSRRVTRTRLGRFTDITVPMIRYLGTIGEDRTLVSGELLEGVLPEEEHSRPPSYGRPPLATPSSQLPSGTRKAAHEAASVADALLQRPRPCRTVMFYVRYQT